MRLAGIRAGDIVRINDGLPYLAEVIGQDGGRVQVAPITGPRGVRTVTSRDVVEALAEGAPTSRVVSRRDVRAIVTRTPSFRGEGIPSLHAECGPVGVDPLGLREDEARLPRGGEGSLRVAALVARRRYAEWSGKRWMFLSALYGLLDPEDEIETYDLALARLSAAERADWGRRVVEALERRLGALDGWVFDVHAGAAHRQAIEGLLGEHGARVVAQVQRFSAAIVRAMVG
jgi:hypothetical protein